MLSAVELVYVLYPEAEYKTTYYAADYKSYNSLPLGETASSPETFWTAVASLVGVIALTALYRQMKLTEEATAETKRSVDTMVEFERGRIHLEDIKLNRFISGEKTGLILTYSYKNPGPGHVQMLEAGCNFKLVGFEESFDSNSIEMKVGKSIIPLPAGESLSTGNGTSLKDGHISPLLMYLSNEEIDTLDKTHLLMICHFAIYDIGHGIKRLYATTYSTSLKNNIVVLTGDDFFVDKPISQTIAPDTTFARVVKKMRERQENA